MKSPRFLVPVLLSLILAVAARAVTFEEWRVAHFTAAELADPAVSGAGANPAGDGLGNLLKYALALDPHLPEVARGLRLTTHQGAPALDFFPQLAAGGFALCAGSFAGPYPLESAQQRGTERGQRRSRGVV